MDIEFEWDPVKEELSLEKHGVSFHEAATVFADPLSWTFPDADHSIREQRYLTIGVSSAGRTVLVSHTDRGKRTRLISACLATRKERRDYEEG